MGKKGRLPKATITGSCPVFRSAQLDEAKVKLAGIKPAPVVPLGPSTCFELFRI